jgi:uncharacterized protein with FMN-binding domain
MPKRGAVALALTAFALVLLLNFQDPAGMAASLSATSGRGGGSVAGVPVGGSATGGTDGVGTPGSGSSGAVVVPVAPAPTPDSGGSVVPVTPAPTPSTGSGSAPQAGTETVTGPTVDTRFGPVQVQVTVSGGQITDVQAVQLPDGDRRSSFISTRVEPVLRSQVLQAQSASIDGVSGATYTSLAYARSLQAALDSIGA